METEIKKWCTYGSWGKKLPSFIGKLESQWGNSGKIRYNENQMYPLEYWDMNYVTVFDSLEEAILFMVENNSNESVLKIKEWLHFPSDTKNVDWDALHKKEIEKHKIKNAGK